MRPRTPEEDAFLRGRYPSAPAREVAAEFSARFGCEATASQLHEWAHDAGVRRGLARVSWRDHPEYDEFLARAIPGRSEREIAEAFEAEFGVRLTRAQVKNQKARLGVPSGTHGGRFEPGHRPANKGRTWDEVMSPEAQARSRQNLFRGGNMPHNALPVGSERTSADGYVEVKVAERPSGRVAHDNWVPKQRLAWERANGRRLRPGEMVVFADGDARNFDPGNLVAMTRAENSVIRKAGIPYRDRATCLAAVAIARLELAASRAQRRPRPCAACGREFEPRFAAQRRCDACIRAGRRAGRAGA